MDRGARLHPLLDVSVLIDLAHAVLQGIVEFLPVSSSAHIAVLSALTGPGIGTDRSALLHVATAAAVLTHYRREFIAALSTCRSLRTPSPGRSFVIAYVCAQFATAAAAAPILLLVSLTPLAAVWDSLLFVGTMLLTNALVLLAPGLAGRDDAGPGAQSQPTLPNPPLGAALLIGLCQGVAAVPGLSRSGLTMAAGRKLGLSPGDAANFSLLLAPPAIVAAAVAWLLSHQDWRAVWFADAATVFATVLSFVLAYAVALLSIPLLVNWVRRGRLRWFAPWSGALGLAAFVIALLN